MYKIYLLQWFSNCGTRTPWGFPKYFRGYESSEQTFKFKSRKKDRLDLEGEDRLI